MDPYSKSILVIHDDADLVRHLAGVLGTHGCRVEQIPCARNAFEQLLRAPLRPRMIVVDWSCTERERFPFLQEKAGNPRLAPIPVVVLADFLQTRTLPTTGVRAILAMPLRPQMIAEVVAGLSGFTSALPVASGIGSYATSVSSSNEARPAPREAADVEEASGRVRLPRTQGEEP